MNNTNWKPILLAGLLGSGLTLGGAWYGLGLKGSRDVVLSEAPADNNLKARLAANPGSVPADFVFAAEKSTPSVVHIKATVSRSNSRQRDMPTLEDIFGGDIFGGRSPQRPQQGQSYGSGVIISGDGYIVTNNHVIDGSSELEVVLNDHRKFKAKLVSTDPNTDIAVIQLQGDKIPNNLPYLSFSNSDDIRVGEWVLAVGNPFNLESTVTAGIVSAKGRSIGILGSEGKADNPIEAFIQTDAAVNPGNSGGALVNLKGELVGINTAIGGGNTGTYVGYAFAVPSNLVKKVVSDLLKYGTVQRGYLGITQMQEVDEQVAREKDLRVSSGIYFGAFGENSSAKAAGLKIGDVITKVDGQPVPTAQRLIEIISQKKPGDAIVVTVNREGQSKDFNVVLRNATGTTDVLKAEAGTASVAVKSIGATLGNITPTDRQRFKISAGARVVEVADDGWMAYHEVPVGFIISQVDGTSVRDARHAASLLEGRRGQVTIIGINPADGERYHITSTLR